MQVNETIQPITLRFVLDDYIRNKDLKMSTAAGYRKIINRCLDDWLELPMKDIKKPMVDERHKELISATVKGPGWAQANLTMRILKALMFHAQLKFGEEEQIFRTNPVSRLAWYKVPRRKGVIKPEEMRDWFVSVLASENSSLRDYLMTLMLTGVRRNEANQLTWLDLDFEKRCFTIRDTKNGEELCLPMTDFLYEIFKRRQAFSKPTNAYVFCGRYAGSKIKNADHALTKIAITFGRPFLLHDLRRTFITAGEAIDTPPYVLKQLVNHRTGRDITFDYIISDPNRLREPMEAINRYILAKAQLV
jgi:integrase